MSAACPVFGFIVYARLRPTVTDVEAGALREDFIELLDTNGLFTSRGAEREFEYVVQREGDQATDADRQLVQRWAGRWASAADFVVSDLRDLNQPLE